MNNNLITKLIVNEIIPNNNKYFKNNIVCSLKKNNINIDYENNTYILKLSKNNNFYLYKNKKIIKEFNIDINFNEIIEYIKNIH